MRQSDAFLKSTAKVRQFLYICKFFANNFSLFSKKIEEIGHHLFDFEQSYSRCVL